jgi:hypothetical protein
MDRQIGGQKRKNDTNRERERERSCFHKPRLHKHCSQDQGHELALINYKAVTHTVLANFNPASVSNFNFLVNPAVTRSSF